MTIVDYIPHAAIAALATVVAYIFKSHDDRDDARFARVGDALLQFNTKMDGAITKQADNHAEILKILLDQKRDR
jgi:hypothetical protein